MLFLNDLLNFLGANPIERILSATLLIAVAYLVYRWLLEPAYVALAGMWNFWRLRHRPSAILEITPPVQSEKSPLATQQLFAVLQQVIAKNEVMPLEMDATHEAGIRYLIHAHPGNIPVLQRQIASYLPEAKFAVLEPTPAEEVSQHSHVFEIKQANHYAYPLLPQENLDMSDPVAFIAGSMAKLKPGERITLQLVLAPHQSYWTARLYGKIEGRGYAILDHKLRQFVVSRPLWVWLITVAYGLITNNLKTTLSLLALLLVVSPFVNREEPELTQAQQQLFADVLAKLNQPLFKTDIRISVSAASNARLYELSSGVTSSLAPLNSPSEQQLHVKDFYPDWLGQKIASFKLRHHMPSFLVTNSNILSASELASIYHFPYGTITTEDMVR